MRGNGSSYSYVLCPWSQHTAPCAAWGPADDLVLKDVPLGSCEGVGIGRV